MSSTADNLGKCRGFSVNAVVETCERISGLKVPVAQDARREGDFAALINDPSKTLAVLGWRCTEKTFADLI
jgi:UDP-glucose 4-epimerase